MNPLISIIIPNYNHARYLDQRFVSVLNQTYVNFEVIILDDCSKDNSREVISKYKDNIKISQIVLNEQNSGSTFLQWEKGIKLAKGDLIWIAESDDFCEFTMLDELIKAYNDCNGCVLSYSTTTMVDDAGAPIDCYNNGNTHFFNGIDYICATFPLGNFVCNASSAIFKREIALKVIEEVATYKGAGDTFFWIALSRFGNVAIVDKHLNYCRRHIGAITNKRQEDGTNYREEYRILNYVKSNIKEWTEDLDDLTKSFRAYHIIFQKFDSIETRQEINHLWNVFKYVPDNYCLSGFNTNFKISKILFRAKKHLFTRGVIQYRNSSVRPLYYIKKESLILFYIFFIKEALCINTHVAVDDYKYACLMTGQDPNPFKALIAPLRVKFGSFRKKYG